MSIANINISIRNVKCEEKCEKIKKNQVNTTLSPQIHFIKGISSSIGPLSLIYGRISGIFLSQVCAFMFNVHKVFIISKFRKVINLLQFIKGFEIEFLQD